MFNIGHIVQHKKTTQVGKIIGHGCQVSENTYFLTFKVQVLRGVSPTPIVEDIVDEWCSWQGGRERLLSQDSLYIPIAA